MHRSHYHKDVLDEINMWEVFDSRRVACGFFFLFSGPDKWFCVDSDDDTCQELSGVRCEYLWCIETTWVCCCSRSSHMYFNSSEKHLNVQVPGGCHGDFDKQQVQPANEICLISSSDCSHLICTFITKLIYPLFAYSTLYLHFMNRSTVSLFYSLLTPGFSVQLWVCFLRHAASTEPWVEYLISHEMKWQCSWGNCSNKTNEVFHWGKILNITTRHKRIRSCRNTGKLIQLLKVEWVWNINYSYFIYLKFIHIPWWHFGTVFVTWWTNYREKNQFKVK